MATRRTDGTAVGVDGSGTFKRRIPGLLVRRAQQVGTALWSRHLGGELASPQYAVLASVYRVPAMDQVTIGRLAALDRSTLADILARLDFRGLIVRVRDPADARRNVVSLTPEGRKLVEKVAPLVEQVDRELVECFSDEEREQFLRQVTRLVKHGEALIADAATEGSTR